MLKRPARVPSEPGIACSSAEVSRGGFSLTCAGKVMRCSAGGAERCLLVSAFLFTVTREGKAPVVLVPSISPGLWPTQSLEWIRDQTYISAGDTGPQHTAKRPKWPHSAPDHFSRRKTHLDARVVLSLTDVLLLAAVNLSDWQNCVVHSSATTKLKSILFIFFDLGQICHFILVFSVFWTMRCQNDINVLIISSQTNFKYIKLKI